MVFFSSGNRACGPTRFMFLLHIIIALSITKYPVTLLHMALHAVESKC